MKTTDIDLIPFEEKKKALEQLSEDDFRDQIVRPLFLKKGFRHGEEMCGADEEGKDCYFVTIDPLGSEMVYAIQTKKGNLTMAADPKKNVQTVIAQMKTLMAATVVDPRRKTKRKPSVGILCASGKINQAARKHIFDEVGEPNIRFIDVNDIVQEVSDHFPEYWQGISADRNPYLKSLHDLLVNANDVLSLANILSDLEDVPVVSEEGFANLRLSRTTVKRKKEFGQVKQLPEIEEIAATTIFGRKKRKFLIKGDPGFGKSTLLRRLAESLIEKGLRESVGEVPVLLRAVSVMESAETLAELAMKVTKQINTITQNSGFSVEDLELGAVTILIDALDEIGDDTDKELLVEKLKDFGADYPNVRIIVTSRFNSFITKSPYFSEFEEWNILPLELRDAQKMLDRAAANKVIPMNARGELLRQLQKIHGIEINPLLVNVMLATTDATRKDIPANITELFSKFCEMMLGRWDSKKGFSQQFESDLKHRILGHLGLEMHRRRVVKIKTEECNGIIRSRLKKLTNSEENVDILVSEILDRSGLLREFEGTIEFRHMLIQEYFAGTAIKEISEVVSVVGDEWWRRVVIFYFGSNPDNGIGLLSTVVDSELKDPASFFCGAVTIGLAAQACYFVDIPDRVEIFRWVAESFSKNKDLYMNSEVKYPLHDFLYHYLTGRDALASDLIEELVCTSGDSDLEFDNHTKFWLVAGLIEAGSADLALKCIDRYKIEERRLLMGLHIGAFMQANGRLSDNEVKSGSEKICDKLELYVVAQRKEFLTEFRSLALEIRGGRIVEADDLDEALIE